MQIVINLILNQYTIFIVLLLYILFIIVLLLMLLYSIIYFTLFVLVTKWITSQKEHFLHKMFFSWSSVEVTMISIITGEALLY